jgi:hypothetical protein
MQPFLKRGFESRTPWYGVSGGTGELDFGFFMGNVYKKDQSIDTGFVKQGWMLRAGYRFDFSKKKYRPLSVFQFRAIPLLSVSLAFSKAGGPSEYITLPLSYGLNVSPGIRIKASVFHLDLKPEINFMYARVRGFRTNPENAFAGFVFTPTVTLGIDGIFDVFTPKHMNERYDYIKLNTDVQKYSTEKYELVYNLYAGGGSGYAKVRREYTITTYSYEPAVMFFDLHLTKPFFSITPIVEFYPKTHFREETRQFGGQFNS